MRSNKLIINYYCKKEEHTLNQANKQDAPVALITGASRRIGAAIAQYLQQAGFRVAIHCHQSIAAAQALAADMNRLRTDSATVFTADLCGADSAHQLVENTLAWAGRIDLLVNNASLFSCNSSDWDALFTLNVKAPFLLSHAAYPHLAVTQGSIINITDIHADKPLKGYAVYCQSKAALSMQTKALAREFAPCVRVNAVAPGAIMWPEQGNQLSELQQQHIIDKTPLNRHGSPLFIAQAVLCLAENKFITGQTLRVDGGRSLTD